MYWALVLVFDFMPLQWSKLHIPCLSVVQEPSPLAPQGAGALTIPLKADIRDTVLPRDVDSEILICTDHIDRLALSERMMPEDAGVWDNTLFLEVIRSLIFIGVVIRPRQPPILNICTLADDIRSEDL